MTGGRAIIIGGGIGGLLASMAAAPSFQEVVLLERDAAWGSGEPRGGAPQGRHPHTLLCGGADAMESLCPGTLEDLRAGGAVEVDFCADLSFFHFGVWKARCPSSLKGTMQTRPLLEAVLAKRATALSNLVHRQGKVLGLLGDPRRVTGVRVQQGDGVALEPADLVIDASGAGSRLPRWLAELGRAPAPEERIPLDVRYATSAWTMTGASDRDWRALILYPKAPTERRAGYVFPVEGGRHLVALAGYLGEQPPLDAAGFRAYARTLPQPALDEAIARGEPAGAIHGFRLPAQRRRRFDRLREPPIGLVAIGDSVCVLDPLFGQGMTVAARQAVLVRDFLAGGLADNASAFRRLHKRVVAATELSWLLTSSEAFRYREALGPGEPVHQLLQAYAARIFRLSRDHADVYRAFMGLMHLTAPLGSVFTPSLLWASLTARPAPS